jgi:uncharacterized protein (DUF433 family)
LHNATSPDTIILICCCGEIIDEEGVEIMTTTLVDIGTLIVRSPEIREGEPRIAGTGVTVKRVVNWYKLGLSPEEITEEIGHLSLAQVYAALTYYHANRAEIEAALVAEEETAKRIEKQHYQAAGDQG